MVSNFDTAYSETRTGLASTKFSADKAWNTIIVNARKLVGADGLDSGQSTVVTDLRKKLTKADAGGANEAVSLYEAAGEDLSGKGSGVSVGADLAKRLGALKTLRHT
jgi:hypothetical protein